MWKVDTDLYTLTGMEFTLFIVVLVVLVGVFVSRRNRRVIAGTIFAIGLGAAAWSLIYEPSPLPTDLRLPGPLENEDFASSNTCRACHPAQYASWHDSFHRTMTQEATADTVLADWDNVILADRGFTTRLFREDDGFWAELPDPLWHQDSSTERPAEPPIIKARVVMTTGAHHLQNYWIRRPADGTAYMDSFDNGAFVQLPWVWMVEDERWSPVQDSFLTPPSPHLEPPAVWNTSCHLCHSVAPEPRFDGQNFDTRTAELGVACESCHGPAQHHAETNRSPARRYSHWLLGAESDPTIINPMRLNSRQSTEVCGQCHSFNRVVDLPGWQRNGVPFRPGEVLADSKALLLYEEVPQDPHLLAQLADEPNALVGRFWKDGTIRVAGREYNGLAESACFQQGEMSCLSCHSLHEYVEVDDQLSATGSSDASCLECHPSFSENPSAHTHHDAELEGSRCQNCHMP
ncbi:hypothetical protein MK280_11575, partial [Myxococcota bacterium]|nr:hypothetical protein [Myxococcota bacterium]